MADIIESFIARLKTQSAVTNLIGDGESPVNIRVYPANDARAPTLPAVVYQRVSAVREQDFDGARGSARSRFQFDILAESYSDAYAVGTALRHALDGFTGTVAGIDFLSTELENEFDSFEQDAELHRLSMDFIFYHSESS